MGLSAFKTAYRGGLGECFTVTVRWVIRNRLQVIYLEVEPLFGDLSWEKQSNSGRSYTSL